MYDINTITFSWACFIGQKWKKKPPWLHITMSALTNRPNLHNTCVIYEQLEIINIDYCLLSIPTVEINISFFFFLASQMWLFQLVLLYISKCKLHDYKREVCGEHLFSGSPVHYLLRCIRNASTHNTICNCNILSHLGHVSELSIDKQSESRTEKHFTLRKK